MLLGRKILRVTCTRPSYFFLTPPRTLSRSLVGRKVLSLDRHGKSLTARLDDGSRLLLHLGMTGQIVTRPLEQDGHVHLVLTLSGRKTLSFRDVRKFGKVELLAPNQTSKRSARLGPDALSIEGAELALALEGRKVAIKTALLNQSLLAGVGNIYADEALYASRIRPTRAAGRLTRAQIETLASEIRSLLQRAVESGGSTINDYMHPDGSLGGFQNWHRVYGKGGEPCPRCKSPIVRRVLGGRSTHFCARCQP